MKSLASLSFVFALLAAGACYAQPPSAIIPVVTDPAGTCFAPLPMRYNSANGKYWGCLNGTWTQVSGSGGGTIPSTTSALKGDGAGNAAAVTGTGSNCVHVDGSSAGCPGGGGTGAAAEAVTTTFSATPTFTATSNTVTTFVITLTGNVTSSTLAGATSGQVLTFRVCQDATGSRTFVPPTNVLGMGTIGATLSTCSNQDFRFDGTNANAIGVMYVTGTGACCQITIPGSTSGSTVLQSTVAASGTVTLPAATDTLVGKATTDTLTNKTFDTGGTGNSLSIAGVAVTANTGTGSVVRATSPTLVTPVLGAAAATTVNKVTITAPATAATLTIPDGVTMTGPAASGTTATLGNNETFSGNKTFTGILDASGATHTQPALKGIASARPGTCTQGELYFATDATAGQNLYFCSSTNTWTQQLNSGAGGGSAGASLFSTTSSTTVTATSATTLIGAATGSTTIPANTFTAGQPFSFHASGYYSTPATPVSLTIDFKVGGTTRISTGAVVQLASVTTGVWNLDCVMTTRTTGASGTQIANCIFVGTGSTLTPAEAAMQVSSAWTIDTTATQAIDLQATWSTATGAPTITSTNVAAWIPGAPVTSVFTQTGAVPDLSGDVTTSGSSATTIAASAVTNAKIANSTINLTTKVTGVLPGANGGVNTICPSGAASSTTSSTAEVSLAQCAIPTGTIGANQAVYAYSIWKFVGTTATKTPTFRFSTTSGDTAGGFMYWQNPSSASSVSYTILSRFQNANSTSAQFTGGPNLGSSVIPVATGSVSEAGTTYVNLNCAVTSASDSCQLLGYQVWIQ
jgi:hypothetical protein